MLLIVIAALAAVAVVAVFVVVIAAADAAASADVVAVVVYCLLFSLQPLELHHLPLLAASMVVSCLFHACFLCRVGAAVNRQPVMKLPCTVFCCL